MPHRKMSREEHDDTVVAISTGVAYIIKWCRIVVPAFLALCAAVLYIGYKAISINDWNNSLVKQPQYAHDRQSQKIVDSTQTADIDTLRSKIPVIRFTRVIQRNGKFIETE